MDGLAEWNKLAETDELTEIDELAETEDDSILLKETVTLWENDSTLE